MFLACPGYNDKTVLYYRRIREFYFTGRLMSTEPKRILLPGNILSEHSNYFVCLLYWFVFYSVLLRQVQWVYDSSPLVRYFWGLWGIASLLPQFFSYVFLVKFQHSDPYIGVNISIILQNFIKVYFFHFISKARFKNSTEPLKLIRSFEGVDSASNRNP